MYVTTPSLFVEMEVLLTFFPWLASKCNLPDLCHPSSWDYTGEQLHPASKHLSLDPFLII
jgi:hypothetical protein